MDGEELIDFFMFIHSSITHRRFMQLHQLKKFEWQHTVANNEAKGDIAH
jgi:hypothetical protein